MEWHWRGKYFPATKAEYNQLRTQLATEPVKREDAAAINASSNFGKKVYFRDWEQQKAFGDLDLTQQVFLRTN